jgi:hypothetical protein|tara:strand:+ start:8445 stop:8669 length:225 start_codon:yes stop_codon:yes gene_type:complete
MHPVREADDDHVDVVALQGVAIIAVAYSALVRVEDAAEFGFVHVGNGPELDAVGAGNDIRMVGTDSTQPQDGCT